MQQTLEDFYKVVRAAGVSISPSDSIETSRTVTLVGYRDRSILRDAFQISLAKSLSEQELVGECFDQFYRFTAFDMIPQLGEKQKNSPSADTSDPIPMSPEDGQGDPMLADMLKDRDSASLSTEMKRVFMSEDVRAIWFFTQNSIYKAGIMQKMGLRELQNQITEAAKRGGRKAMLKPMPCAMPRIIWRSRSKTLSSNNYQCLAKMRRRTFVKNTSKAPSYQTWSSGISISCTTWC